MGFVYLKSEENTEISSSYWLEISFAMCVFGATYDLAYLRWQFFAAI
jgi:hypothetical protein